jgi:argininosuccinate lyase
VNADYSTTTEIADALLQKAEVPFRTGHHFASKLTDYGRGKGLKIHEIPYREAQRIYEEQAKDKLPLAEAEFREVISAEYMVFGRKGLGGPQVNEIQRMLTASRSLSNACASWCRGKAENLTQQTARTGRAFQSLCNN